MKSLIAVLAVLALGCASAETFRSSPNVYPEVPQEEVLLFFSKDDIQVPYEVIGRIMMGGSSAMGVDCNDLVKKAQKKAGKMGANGIIARDCDQASGASAIAKSLFGGQDSKMNVTAVRLDYK